MKMMVKLAVLFAMLLLLTGVSYAGMYAMDCDCYEITATDVDNPTNTHTESVIVCLDYGAKNGKVCAPDPYGLDLSLFFDALGLKILAYNKDCVGSFKVHGSDNNVVTGIGFCEGNTRWTIWGHKTDVPCPLCAI
jgi:hypothetical protein